MSTLKQVAAAAGVHPGTASAVLNQASGNTRVSDVTRDKVLQAAQALSYVPNRHAAALKKGRSSYVGFFGGDVRNPFFAELLTCLERQLAAKGLQVLTSQFTYSAGDSLASHLQSLLEQQVRAIVYWDESDDWAGRHLIRPGHVDWLPIGFTQRERPGVWLDLEHGIRETIRHFRRRGCQRAYLLAPDPAQAVASPSVGDRLDCFLNACREEGLDGIASIYAGDSWDVQAASAGGLELIARLEGPEQEGILTFNDVAGLGLLAAGCSSGQAALLSEREIVCFDGTRLIRSWGGNVCYLDLCMEQLVGEIVHAIVSGGATTSSRIQPKLCTPEPVGA